MDLCAELDALRSDLLAGFSEMNEQLARLEVRFERLNSQPIQMNVLMRSSATQTRKLLDCVE
jgi:hypothetical protein